MVVVSVVLLILLIMFFEGRDGSELDRSEAPPVVRI